MSLSQKNKQSNENIVSDYLHRIIFPFVEQNRKELNLDQDAFKGQTISAVTDLSQKYNYIVIYVPNNHANVFRPLDISVNKSAKCFLTDKCRDWYAYEVSKQLKQLI